MTPDSKTCFDRAQQVLIPLDLQVWVQTALHENPRTAQIYRLLNFAQNRLDGENVAFGMSHGPVKGTKTTVLRAKIRVIDIAVDNVADYTIWVKLAPHHVGLLANRKQVVTSKKIDGLATRDHKL